MFDSLKINVFFVLIKYAKCYLFHYYMQLPTFDVHVNIIENNLKLPVKIEVTSVTNASSTVVFSNLCKPTMKNK